MSSTKSLSNLCEPSIKSCLVAKALFSVAVSTKPLTKSPTGTMVGMSVVDNAIIGKGVFVGSHAVITCGVKVGDYAKVSAGSIVTEDVAIGATVFGVPASSIM